MLGPFLVSYVLASCPDDMVFASSRSCIDRFAWPNDPESRPVLGLSAQRETYLDLRGQIWDLETLCASRGKRVCTSREWRAACEGTSRETCPALVSYRAPRWERVQRRDPFELARLVQQQDAAAYPNCTSATGARMMGTIQEWVRHRRGFAFSRAFWSREASCQQLTTSHDPRWHDYATGGRCCLDL